MRFGPKRENVAEYWRRLRNGELHDLYLPDITVMLSKVMGWASHVARLVE
jgi:hypothetical protein